MQPNHKSEKVNVAKKLLKIYTFTMIVDNKEHYYNYITHLFQIVVSQILLYEVEPDKPTAHDQLSVLKN